MFDSMQIKNLKIENFRKFESLDIDFNGITALVGANGSGKTTILEALNLVSSKNLMPSRFSEDDFYNEKEITIELEFDNCFFVEVIEFYTTLLVPAKKIKLVVSRRSKSAANKALNTPFTLTQLVIPEIFEDISKLKFDAKITELIKGNQEKLIDKSELETIGEGQIGYTFFYSTKAKTNQIKRSQRSLNFNNDFREYPNIFYLPKDREKDTKKGFSTLLDKINDELNWRYRKDVIIDEWNKYYIEVVKRVDKEHSKLFNPVKQKMVDYFGTEFNNLELSLIDVGAPFSNSFFSIREDNGLKQVKSSGLGSGQLLILSYYLIQNIINLSKEKFIILVDEPEKHLHPQAQHKLYKEIFESKIQFIYSTHSTCFIDVSKWNAIKRIHNNEIYPKPAILLEQDSGQKLLQHLNDMNIYYQDKTVFKKEHNEIFFDRFCIIVEGVIDKYSISLIEEKYIYSTFLIAYGKDNLARLIRLAKAFGIDYFVIYDEDNNSTKQSDITHNTRIKNIIEQLVKPDKSNLYSFNNSLEDVFGVSSDSKRKFANVIDKINFIKEQTVQNFPIEITTLIQKLNNWVASKSEISTQTPISVKKVTQPSIEQQNTLF